MGRTMVRWLAAARAGLVSVPAEAQRGRTYRSAPRGRIEAPRFGDPRLPNAAVRPVEDGIIHWNTPNKDGNLGGPGTGGGGGGGG